MAMRPIEVRSHWELMALLKDKAHIIHLHLANCPSVNALAIDDLGKEISRMAELHLGLKEAVAALPRPTHPAPEGKRA